MRGPVRRHQTEGPQSPRAPESVAEFDSYQRIDRRLPGLAEPDYDATISFGLPFELGDCLFWNHLGITLRELSERTGIAAGYLSEIERGHKPGSASALARIAGALGTKIDTLLSG